ncbi:MAG: PH domain-containing protein [Gammaproteobacteria bacterium]|nr:PH domain-containing protein [Gammaproteobacteria bacterium]
MSAATVVLMVYAMLSTKYRVVDGVLHLHQGPFRRSVDLESISRIRVGGPMFGAPLYGMGTRGLFIYYRLGVVGVTPKDVDGFLAAIGARRTESGDVEIAR